MAGLHGILGTVFLMKRIDSLRMGFFEKKILWDVLR